MNIRLRFLRFLARCFRVPLYFGAPPWLSRQSIGKDRSRATMQPLSGRQRHRNQRLGRLLAKKGDYSFV